MSLNINITTRRKQLAILIGIIITGAAAATGIMLYGGENKAPQNAGAAPAPNMTGVVTATFNEEVNVNQGAGFYPGGSGHPGQTGYA